MRFTLAAKLFGTTSLVAALVAVVEAGTKWH